MNRYMDEKIYIKDFVEDLNYRKVILYVGNVDENLLYERLIRDMVNHLHEFEHVIETKFMFIENCDLQGMTTDWVLELVTEQEYDIYNLYQDVEGFYITTKL